jgi:hypothetical protein
MKMTRRQLKKVLLQEGLLNEVEIVSMVVLLAKAAMAVLAVGTPAALIYAHKMLDERMKKAFTRRDLEKIRQSPRPDETVEQILKDKGLVKGSYGIPEIDLDDPDAARRRKNYFRTDNPFEK